MRTFFHVQNKTAVVPNNVPQHFNTDVGIFFFFHFKTVKQKPMTLVLSDNFRNLKTVPKIDDILKNGLDHHSASKTVFHCNSVTENQFGVNLVQTK